MSRPSQRDAFLKTAGWANATALPLAGDASSRRYDRLTFPGSGITAVLMDAPPDRGEDTRPFVRIAKHLSHLGLSAPDILSENCANGFLLLEDLGDAVLARLVEADPAAEVDLYRAATDVLLALHTHPAPDALPDLGIDKMAQAVDLSISWYATGCGRDPDPSDVLRVQTLTARALEAIPPARDVLALRDFHAENLIWLPERQGAARVGLLDFQDAFAGHPAYDLVSMLEDARRDVSPSVRAEMIEHYIARSGLEPEAFRVAYATLGAQRNLRILGVFARLSMHFGKPDYVDLIPRVWAHLQSDLAHPVLSDLAGFLAKALPTPTPDRLERIKRLCGTFPTP